MCEEAGQCWLFPSLLPSSQITLSTTLPSAPKAKYSGHCPCSSTTPLPTLVPTPINPYFAGCADAAWLTLTLYGLKQVCSKQGSPDMQPWIGSKLLFISFCFMGMYFYSIWPCPDGLAKTHIAQKESKHPVVGIMLVSCMQFLSSYGLIWSLLLDHKGS